MVWMIMLKENILDLRFCIIHQRINISVNNDKISTL